MHTSYVYPKYAYETPPDLGGCVSRPVVVIGAGPAGLCAAIDLAQQGQPVLLLDDDNTVSVGSRGLCYAKRTLEILDRLQVGDAVVNKGVSWNVGRTFNREQEVYQFNLLPEPGHERPGMINLQQYYLEEFLVKRAGQLPNLDIRWQNKVTAVTPYADHALLDVETADGTYQIRADWVIAADGARSNIRRQLGLEIDGKVFQDRFLIADVVMKAQFPAERWFWFDPPFHPNQSVLLHREADNVWRIDFQLGWDADPEEEKKPERVIPRIKAMLGEQHAFDLEWVSVYTFQCRRMKEFRHGRVLFVGDAAHQVSPFGARGANSGIQDTDNLAWKLRLVINGHAPESLLDSYSEERVAAADENVMNSTRSTDFITPKTPVSRLFRNAVLDLAKTHGFARALVNSGRLSVPSFYYRSGLNTADCDVFAGMMIPGAPLDDAPVLVAGQPGWLLRHLADGFTAIIYWDPKHENSASLSSAPSLLPQGQDLQALLGEVERVQVNGLRVTPLVVAHAGLMNDRALRDLPPGVQSLIDREGRFAQRFDAQHLTVYLVRPDQHVAARWRVCDAIQLSAALARALGQPAPHSSL